MHHSLAELQPQHPTTHPITNAPHPLSPHTNTQELIYKRGFGKVNKSRIPLTDNSVIEGTLGKVCAVLCSAVQRV